jgi:hypothetical protein
MDVSGKLPHNLMSMWSSFCHCHRQDTNTPHDNGINPWIWEKGDNKKMYNKNSLYQIFKNSYS